MKPLGINIQFDQFTGFFQIASIEEKEGNYYFTPANDTDVLGVAMWEASTYLLRLSVKGHEILVHPTDYEWVTDESDREKLERWLACRVYQISGEFYFTARSKEEVPDNWFMDFARLKAALNTHHSVPGKAHDSWMNLLKSFISLRLNQYKKTYEFHTKKDLVFSERHAVEKFMFGQCHAAWEEAQKLEFSFVHVQLPGAIIVLNN